MYLPGVCHTHLIPRQNPLEYLPGLTPRRPSQCHERIQSGLLEHLEDIPNMDT